MVFRVKFYNLFGKGFLRNSLAIGHPRRRHSRNFFRHLNLQNLRKTIEQVNDKKAESIEKF